jgi:hypothetical protein
VQLPIVAGRDFFDSDHESGEVVAAWLSYRFWTREFGKDHGVIGQQLDLRAGNRAGGQHIQHIMVAAQGNFGAFTNHMRIAIAAGAP